MEKPTEADIKRIMNEFECHAHLDFPEKLYDEVLGVGDAYLALKEEVEKSELEWVEQNALYILACKDRDELKADNQVLRTLMETMTINIPSPMSVKPDDGDQ